jgi:hypothetical protein
MRNDRQGPCRDLAGSVKQTVASPPAVMSNPLGEVLARDKIFGFRSSL